MARALFLLVAAAAAEVRPGPGAGYEPAADVLDELTGADLLSEAVVYEESVHEPLSQEPRRQLDASPSANPNPSGPYACDVSGPRCGWSWCFTAASNVNVYLGQKVPAAALLHLHLH